MSRRAAVARAIYMTHWQPGDFATGRRGAPQWEQVSDAVREWTLAQADAAIAAYEAWESDDDG
jgi:hypothetical protein